MLVNQNTLQLRPARETDAEALLGLMQSVEAAFDLLYEPGERSDDPRLVRAQIADFASRANCRFLVAESDGALVGFLTVEGGKQRRRARVAYLIMSVGLDCHGKGVGAALLAEAVSWAESAGMNRIELVVLETNRAGRRLYQKLGFEQEGLLRRYVMVRGEPVNALLMAKLLNPRGLTHSESDQT